MTNMNKTNEHAAAFRLGHLGDVVLTTGVLERWFDLHSTRFTFITKESSAPVLEHHPAVERILTVPDTALAGTGNWLKWCKEINRELGPIPLYDLHGTLRSRMLSMRWKGPVLSYPKFGIKRRIFSLTNGAIFKSSLEATNVPQRYSLALDSRAPQRRQVLPKIFLTEQETSAAKKALSAFRTDLGLVALHPYATHPAKRWPADHWQQLASLLDENNIGWFVVGRDKKPLPDAANNLTNKTGLRETCALLSQADTLITNDSGPMHLASGVQTPVIAIFGPTAKAWGFYPSGPNDTVLELPMDCRPCSLHGSSGCPGNLDCLRKITPNLVFRTLLERISSQA